MTFNAEARRNKDLSMSSGPYGKYREAKQSVHQQKPFMLAYCHVNKIALFFSASGVFPDEEVVPKE